MASDKPNDFADGIAASALRLLAEGLPRVKAKCCKTVTVTE